MPTRTEEVVGGKRLPPLFDHDFGHGWHNAPENLSLCLMDDTTNFSSGRLLQALRAEVVGGKRLPPLFDRDFGHGWHNSPENLSLCFIIHSDNATTFTYFDPDLI
ncbi:hypothetical protein [Nodularia sp. NIES-3585]|uniref:hypothetical protein n=1 Tax=Nodularia sp. NIES-3585 TaxID=1973477 RepID=UPI000B5CA0FC|nr:hypothetical protein [Nodularia sp. NIES-3585]